MSITLNLSPELEARLRADAERQQLPIEVLAITRLGGLYLDAPEEGKRMAALERLHGALAETGLELDDFLNERRADVERENSSDEF